MILCRVLGPVELTVDGRPAPPELLWRKHLALLIYLARSPRRTRTREHLTGLLWPDKDESAARHSLNEALRIIRKAGGEDAIDSTGGQVRLDPEAVHLDADDLEVRAAGQDWVAAEPLVMGEFLEGFGLPGSDGFEDWLAAERRRWTALSVRVLLAQEAKFLREGRAEEALALARRADSIDGHSEPVARAVMGALAVLGDPGAALDHFAQYSARVAREVGTVPGSEAQALAARIRAGRRVHQPAAPGAPDGRERRRTPLVGRGRELAGLLEHWDRSRAESSATALLVVGDAGTGKTRLLEELLARTRVAGGTGVLVRAVESDRDSPGAGLIGLARGGLLDAPGIAASAPEAIGVFAARIPEWADRFAAARPAPDSTLRSGFGALLGTILGEGPVMLAVDDAQWMDRESLLVLLAALRDHARMPLCLVLSADAAPPNADLDELRRRLGTDVPGVMVPLAPLDREALCALAAWALPGYDAVALERVVRRVGNDSAGLPLLAVELFSAIAQGMVLAPDSATWPAPFRTLSQTLPGDLPDSVVAALRIGFRRLSREAQQVLVAAAVTGERSSEPELCRASGFDPAVVAAALDELEWQRWLEADGRGYGFVARVAAQVVARDMVTPGQRDRIRARAGLGPVP